MTSDLTADVVAGDIPDSVKELIARVEKELANERQSDRLERIIAAIAQDLFEHNPMLLSFENAAAHVLSTEAGIILYERLLKARVRER